MAHVAFQIAMSKPQQSIKLCHILLVEDHADTLRMMVRLLTREGLTVTAASSAAAAKNFIAGGKFDLLITDLTLPDGTGHEILSEWKRRGLGPAIAISGSATQDDVHSMHDAGFTMHFVKPVSFNAITAGVTRALESCGCQPVSK
jgi:DNA-binding NtrC family response regulator